MRRTTNTRPAPIRGATRWIVAVAALAAALAAPIAGADPYIIRWFTVDCGGGTSTATNYELQGTVAQFDAQPPAAAGDYAVTGGYWNPSGEANCPADFNNSGSVTVQDLFDFLQAYFGGCFTQSGPPCLGRSADFNGNGQISVQDIFDFLAAWFVGCPA